ncbi:relaxase/mobilization nuclease domain-containing protein [Sphingobacterium composti Ten et al. 2007 non Yoo et al. 2007]|uniref:relaxase/mobilization nuclease domain-containing protein n=1 Tax=Sphingobacterium composti TaxID=363260 RepID=UPI00135BC082|nr:hypothetical protein [Sphingobacterium composti Ten et al. 2007 non Yoo et al. 2007]
MKVVIFNNQSSFKGVMYNIAKVSSDRAELMCAENFHALGILRYIKPHDYIDYLLSISAASRIEKPQFHAIISCQQEIQSKWNLTFMAKSWLEEMGYGKQPYLIFFHYDTNINHVHIVSTRVNKNGKGISDSFEGIKAYSELNKVLGIDSKRQAQHDLDRALNYTFSSRMEFIMLLYALRYSAQIKNETLALIKHGKIQAEVCLKNIYNKISNGERSSLRLQELREIFAANLKKYDASIQIKEYMKYQKFSSSPIRCTSEFILQLKNSHNIQLIFHGRSRKMPTDYCVIDHQSKTVFEGSYIWPLSDFIRSVNKNNISESRAQSDFIDRTQALDSDYKESSGISILDFQIDIIEELEPNALNKRRKNKKYTIP